MLSTTILYNYTMSSYNFGLILVYIYAYIFSIFVLFTFEHLNISNLNKIFTVFSMHNRISWGLIFLIMAGTPPFLIFFSKVFFFSLLLSFKYWGFVLLLLLLNIVLFYIYLQNFIFLKKSSSTTFITITISPYQHISMFFIQTVYIYFNIVAFFFFPLFFGFMFLLI